MWAYATGFKRAPFGVSSISQPLDFNSRRTEIQRLADRRHPKRRALKTGGVSPHSPVQRKYRQNERRRRIRRAIDAMGSFVKILRLGCRDVNEGLRIAIHQREPRTL